jgi:thiamine thiazole synthase
VQADAKRILDAFGIRCREFAEGYYTADSIECVTGLGHKAVQAGATFLNLVTVEDVALRDDRLTGIVINWTAVEMGGLHVDPLSVATRYVIDCTGHDTDVVRMVEGRADRGGRPLLTPSGKIEGQGPLWADRAERTTIENTREVYPGLYVAGMSANATWGSFRMGPIFGGMLLSGEKVARLVAARLEECP